ncbi:tetratricopeptide repeat protein [Amphritea japonica]|nr:hypothetical protein [Amphritea japonica]
MKLKDATVTEYIQEIKQLIQLTDLAEAQLVLDEASELYPENFQLKLLGGRIRTKADGDAAGELYYKSLKEKFPGRAIIDVELAKLAIYGSQFEVATNYINSAKEKGLQKGASLDLESRVASGAGDILLAKNLLSESIKEEYITNIQRIIRLVELFLRLDDYESAKQTIDQLCETYPDNVIVRKRAFEVAKFAPGEEDALLLWLKISPDNPEVNLQALRFYRMMGHREKAKSLLLKGLERNWDSHKLFRRARWVLGSFKADDHIKVVRRAIEWAQSVTQEDSLRVRLFAKELLIELGGPVPALLQNFENSEAPLLQDWFDLTPDDKQLKRPVKFESYSEDVNVACTENHSPVVIVFTGLADKAMLPAKALDRFFAAKGWTAIYLQDSNRILYNEGIRSVAESFEDTLSYLRALLKELKATHLITFGTSAGGYGALRYGVELGAEKILGFSAPTNITEGFLANDGRGQVVTRRFKRLEADALDIKGVIRKTNYSGKIELYYAENHPQDSMHALYLADEPTVALRPLKGLDVHYSLLPLIQNEKFLGILDTVDQSLREK